MIEEDPRTTLELNVMYGVCVVLVGMTVTLLCGAEVPPSPSLTLPCVVTRVHDGDTVTVEIKVTADLRLLDCWAPELKEEMGPKARDRMKALAEGKKGVVSIPIDNMNKLGDALTFGRVLGRLWIDNQDVGALLVKEELATKKKRTKQ